MRRITCQSFPLAASCKEIRISCRDDAIKWHQEQLSPESGRMESLPLAPGSLLDPTSQSIIPSSLSDFLPDLGSSFQPGADITTDLLAATKHRRDRDPKTNSRESRLSLKAKSFTDSKLHHQRHRKDSRGCLGLSSVPAPSWLSLRERRDLIKIDIHSQDHSLHRLLRT